MSTTDDTLSGIEPFPSTPIKSSPQRFKSSSRSTTASTTSFQLASPPTSIMSSDIASRLAASVQESRDMEARTLRSVSKLYTRGAYDSEASSPASRQLQFTTSPHGVYLTSSSSLSSLPSTTRSAAAATAAATGSQSTTTAPLGLDEIVDDVHADTDWDRPRSEENHRPTSVGVPDDTMALLNEPATQLPADMSGLTSGTDVIHMEQVRGHLQNMLRNASKGAASDEGTNDYQLTLSDPVNELLEGSGGKGNGPAAAQREDSFDSIRTDTLLSAKPFEGNNTSLNSTGLWGGGPVSRAPSADGTLHAENQLLKDGLERERFRRKHCEKQIQTLQSRLLETQQQLAVAVNQEKKKNAMIGQLDQTLAKVVEGWKQRDGERNALLHTLGQEKEALQTVHYQQQQILSTYEADLDQTRDVLAQEREKLFASEQDKKGQLEKLTKERGEMLRLMENERRQFEKNEEDVRQALLLKEQAQQQLEKLHLQNDQERVHWQEMERQLKEKIDLITEEHVQAVAQEKTKVDRETATAEQYKSRFSEIEKEAQHLKHELDTMIREKENLKVEISLMEAKYEAGKNKQETEFHSQLEREVSARMTKLHEEVSQKESELQANHRQQVTQMQQEHAQEMEQLRSDLQQEVDQRAGQLKQLKEDHQRRVEELSVDNGNLRQLFQAVDAKRKELVKKLQSLVMLEASPAHTTQPTNRLPVQTQPTNSRLPFQTQATNSRLPSQIQATNSRLPYYTQVTNSGPPQPHIRPPHQWPHTHYAGGDGTTLGQPMTFQPESSTESLEQHFLPLERQVVNETATAVEEFDVESEEGDETAIYLEPSSTPRGERAHYQSMDERFEQHEMRQEELQHYIKLLLERSPGDVEYQLPAEGSRVGPEANQSQRSPVKNQRRAAPADAVNSTVFPATVRGQQHQVRGQMGSVVQKTRVAGPPAANYRSQVRESPVRQHPSFQQQQQMLQPQQPNTPPQKGPLAEQQAPDASLSPQQLGEISRLLSLYRRVEDTQELPTATQLLSYLSDLRHRSENDRGQVSQPPPAPHASKRGGGGPQPQARRSLQLPTTTSQPQPVKMPVKSMRSAATRKTAGVGPSRGGAPPMQVAKKPAPSKTSSLIWK